MTALRTVLPVALGLLWLVGCASSRPPAAPAPEGAADALAALETRLLTEPAAFAYHIISRGAFAADLRGMLEMTRDSASLTAEGGFGGIAQRLQLVADGAEVEIVAGDSTVTVAQPPALREALVLGLTRMGLLHNLARLTVADLPDHAEGGVAEWIETHSAAWGPTVEVEGMTARTLQFALRVAGTEAAEATLWLDPATGLPIRRDQTVDFPGGTMTVVERYSGWTFPEPPREE